MKTTLGISKGMFISMIVLYLLFLFMFCSSTFVELGMCGFYTLKADATSCWNEGLEYVSIGLIMILVSFISLILQRSMNLKWIYLLTLPIIFEIIYAYSYRNYLGQDPFFIFIILLQLANIIFAVFKKKSTVQSL